MDQRRHRAAADTANNSLWMDSGTTPSAPQSCSQWARPAVNRYFRLRLFRRVPLLPISATGPRPAAIWLSTLASFAPLPAATTSTCANCALRKRACNCGTTRNRSSLLKPARPQKYQHQRIAREIAHLDVNMRRRFGDPALPPRYRHGRTMKHIAEFDLI